MEKKKLFLFFVLAIFAAQHIVAETYNGKCGDKIIWSFDTQTGSLVIDHSETFGNDYMYEFEEEPAPWYPYRLGIYKVTLGRLYNISRIAFIDCINITSISIPSTVKTIGEDAFNGCTSLSSLKIGENVDIIDNTAFLGCPNLSTISVSSGNLRFSSPDNCNAIIKRTNEAGNTRVLVLGGNNTTIPDNVTSIGQNAFNSRAKLTSITLPNSVVGIGISAFANCTGLTSFTMPSSVNTIGNYAFDGCTELAEIYVNMTTPPAINSTVFQGVDKKNCKLIVPAISLNAYKAAAGWSSFSHIEADPTRTIYYTTSDGNVCQPLASAFGAIMLSNNYVNGQGYIWFGANVTSIGNDAYSGCSKLKSATIPSSVTSIGSNAYKNCTALTSITIPSNVASIGNSAFLGCSSLKSVTIERTTPCTSTNDMFDGCSSLERIYVPVGTVNTYKSAAGWSTYADKIVEIGTPAIAYVMNYTSSDGKVVSPLSSAFGANILSNTYSNNQGCISFDASVTTIGSNAFKGCSTLASLTIPNSVTSIGDYAFQNCSGLTALTIPNSVTSIGDYAFLNCSGLTALTIPNSVTSIGRNAFSGCSGLTSITIPNSVTSIEFGAFKSCTGLTSIVIPSGVTSIGGALISSPRLTSIIVEESNKVFDSRGNCNAIIETATNMLIQGCETTTIPNNVTSIGEEAFYGCKGLTALTIPNSVTSIGRNAFTGCSGLTALTIPNSVTSIGNSAFVSCTGLTSVTIPSSVTSIGTYAFRWCSGLNSVTVEGATPCTFASYVFAGCTALEKIYVPAGTAEVYKAAEGWSAYADKIVALPQEGGTEGDDEGDDEGGTEDNDDIIESTDISTMDYVLFIPSTEVNVGSESELQLNLKNATEDITAFECKVYLPEGVEWAYTIDKRGNKVYNLPTFNEDRTDASYHTINAVKQMSDGGYYVIVYSGSNEYILETEGTILNLPVVVSEEAVAGDYNIFVKGIVITDTDANQTLIDQTVSKLTIVDYTLGDANNDGMINVTDVVTVIAYMLEDNPASFVFKAGDVNADGQINVTDIVGIINIMLADDSPAAASARRGQILRQALAAAAKGNSLEIVPFTVAQGTTSKSVTLDLVNPGDEFTAFECKVYLPEGIDWAYTVDKRGKIVYTLPTFNSEADRTDATYHTINAIKKMSDGGYYIIVYSGNNKVILDEEGAVLNLPLTFDENLAESVYDIRIGDIVLSRTNTTQELLDDYTTSVVVGSPSAKSLVLHGDFTADAVKELNTALASNTSVCSIDFSEAFALADAEVKTANENLLVYVGEGQKVANTCNVVAAGVCANLVLTDGKPFGPAKTFTVKAGEYGRKLAADEYATIVLPFAPDAETLKGYTFYELTAAEAAMLTFDEVTALEAGMPYIVIADGSATKLTAEAESTVAIESASTEADGWTMTGTYESVVFTNADELASLYCISGNQFKQATSKLTMNPFRAYFVGDGSVKSIQLRGGDGSTRIIDLEGEQAAGQLYDVLGRQVDHAAQGIYIQNGKKVLVK